MDKNQLCIWGQGTSSYKQNRLFKVNVCVRIFNVLSYQGSSLTRRQISVITGIEIGTLCRALYDLVRQRRVEVSYYARCRTTGKMVMHYSVRKSIDGSRVSLSVLQ